MKSLWNDADAKAAIDRWANGAEVNDDIALRTYTSRLIGSEAKLVLHGGGNTSVKTRLVDDTGELVDVLCVKGSGWDLGAIEPPGLPAVRLESLGALRARESLSDEAMVSAQRTRLLDASSPNPSVETLLHAFLPAKFIDHSHADAILAVVDQPDAEAICAKVFGETLAVVPYIMPGFALSKLAAEVQERYPDVEGLLLLKHGLFTWGDTAKESYERHIVAVTKAEEAIAGASSKVKRISRTPVDWTTLGPVLRGALSRGTGKSWLLHHRTSESVERYLEREDLLDVSQRGTPTPDHVIRTKRVPMVLDLAGREGDAISTHIEEKLAAYREKYAAYVTREAAAKGRTVTALDANPRVILVPGLGLLSAATTMKAAHVAADLHEHCIEVIEGAEALGTYEVLPESDVFDMEYWSLEQAKLGKKTPRLL
ncbi:MAG: rhamnose utilization protein RhaD (predicted bifunctional aldolase and dehydrogenase), partial [Polyangiales bacterium]